MDIFGKRLKMAELLEAAIRSRRENKRIAIVGSSGIHPVCPSIVGNMGINDCAYVFPQIGTIRVYDDRIETDYGVIMEAANQIKLNNYIPSIIYRPSDNHLLSIGIDPSKEHYTFEMPSDNAAIEALRKARDK